MDFVGHSASFHNGTLYRQRYEFFHESVEGGGGYSCSPETAGTSSVYSAGSTFLRPVFPRGKGVLIPRPETEELVEWIVSDCQKAGKVRFLDIGTGSGCIPVTLAERLPEAEVASCDISAEALRVAAANVKRYGDKVTLFQADILQDELPDCQVDVLVSNPPYITDSERKDMEANVLDWEPELALFVPDTDPLRFYRRIAQKGLDWLTEGGALYFEINRAYGAETVRMLEECGYRDIALRKDLSGNDRMIKAVRP